ncbi:MAG: SpoIID/LytB domain-containing protein [Elusimicrobia bacterium]|nr:SpoIID/LytB domain-containing protein [Elusimicrobiota bacterium]
MTVFRIFCLSFLFLLLVFLPLSSLSANASPRSRPVRVALLKGAEHFSVAVDGRYEILDGKTRRVLKKGARLKKSLVMVKGRATRIGEESFLEERVVLEPMDRIPVLINNRPYRGDILIIRSPEGLTAINYVDLERYVQGVLYREISDKWPLEAIKAQAVATRTYAIYSQQTYAGRDYDVTSDVYSQVYGGKAAERYRTNLGVKRTRGEVLTYGGKIFPTFFHANSGGITESAAELWTIDLPPLRGGIRSSFSVDSPHYRWKRNLRLKDIQDKLNAKGYSIGLIKEISIQERNPSGRVRRILLTSRDGQTLELSGKDFRQIVGPDILKSNLYEIEMQGWYVDFVGHGWGHGVGLDQWGARNMARERFTYQQILQFYYPGSSLTKE